MDNKASPIVRRVSRVSTGPPAVIGETIIEFGSKESLSMHTTDDKTADDEKESVMHMNATTGPQPTLVCAGGDDGVSDSYGCDYEYNTRSYRGNSPEKTTLNGGRESYTSTSSAKAKEFEFMTQVSRDSAYSTKFNYTTQGENGDADAMDDGSYTDVSIDTGSVSHGIELSIPQTQAIKYQTQHTRDTHTHHMCAPGWEGERDTHTHQRTQSSTSANRHQKKQIRTRASFGGLDTQTGGQPSAAHTKRVSSVGGSKGRGLRPQTHGKGKGKDKASAEESDVQMLQGTDTCAGASKSLSKRKNSFFTSAMKRMGKSKQKEVEGEEEIEIKDYLGIVKLEHLDLATKIEIQDSIVKLGILQTEQMIKFRHQEIYTGAELDEADQLFDYTEHSTEMHKFELQRREREGQQMTPASRKRRRDKARHLARHNTKRISSQKRVVGANG